MDRSLSIQSRFLFPLSTEIFCITHQGKIKSCKVKLPAFLQSVQHNRLKVSD